MIHTCITHASTLADNSPVNYETSYADPRKLIEHLRVQQGFRSLRALAIAAGVSQPTLQRYMTGHTATMEASTFMALAHTLGVTMSELLGEVPLGSSIQVREMQRLMQDLSTEQQEQLLRIGRALTGPINAKPAADPARR
jgi:transcriptional regulator with XRE-family HTH domain